MASTKEMKELIIAGFAVAGIIGAEVKDGLQGEDFKVILEKLMTDKEFQMKLIEGIDGAGKVLEEAQDIDVFEGIGLARLVIDQIQELGEKLK